MICVGLLLSYCFVAKPEAVDSFCQLYQPVVQVRGDGTISASSGTKRRLLVNELTYRKLCNASASSSR